MRKSTILYLAILAISVQLSFSLFGPQHLIKYAQKVGISQDQVKNPELYDSSLTNTQYTQGYFKQVLDHFNYGYGSPSSLDWNMRYLYSDEHWGGKDNLSPIFFYCGNEGDIDGFWNNSGYMVDYLAPQFKAYLLFPEHRYFGKSLPFGPDSFKKENVAYLTTDQALADFAVFIRYYKTEVLNCPDCPVITFGGSYGGMLASWMRMKYPNVVDGAWAASAPILYFDGVVPEEAFFSIVSYDFGNSSAVPQCGELIKEGFNRMDKYINQPDGDQYQALNQIFNVCHNLTSNKDISVLEDYISNAYTYMAMVDYPYPTRFLMPMPGNPVNFSCQAFTGLDRSSSDEDIFTAMYKAAMVFYNYQNASKCNEIFESDDAGLGALNGLGWNVLACSQVSLPMGSNGIDDIFPARPWSYEESSAMCKKTYNLQTRYDWALDEFGGRDIQREFKAYSNIFFSNGLLDPWSAGGVLVNISDTVVSYVIEGAAHHLDLRAPNDLDPESVNFVRQKEADYIGMFIEQKQELVRNRNKEISI